MYVHRRYMAASLLWIAGIVLESVILFRLLKCRLFAHYPFFFAYMAVVCSLSIALWPIYQFHYVSYPKFFWAKQFLNLLAGFGVLFEIVRKSFQRYPGARNFATTVLAAMFAILCGYFAFRLLPLPLAVANEGCQAWSGTSGLFRRSPYVESSSSFPITESM